MIFFSFSMTFGAFVASLGNRNEPKSVRNHIYDDRRERPSVSEGTHIN